MTLCQLICQPAGSVAILPGLVREKQLHRGTLLCASCTYKHGSLCTDETGCSSQTKDDRTCRDIRGTNLCCHPGLRGSGCTLSQQGLRGGRRTVAGKIGGKCNAVFPGAVRESWHCDNCTDARYRVNCTGRAGDRFGRPPPNGRRRCPCGGRACAIGVLLQIYRAIKL